ncbi:MAG: hypothetical protein AB8B50_06930 [Pirellulaceae bacterium]
MKSDPNDSEFDRRLREELHGLAVPETLAASLHSNILGTTGSDDKPAAESRMDAMLESVAAGEPFGAGAEQGTHGSTLSNSRASATEPSRRRGWLFALAGAAAAAVIGFTVFHFATTPPGMTKRAFAAWMENELAEFEATEANSIDHNLPPAVLAFLTQNLRLQKMGVSGEYKVPSSQDSPGTFDGTGTAWKLVGESGVLYVAVLENVNLTERLPSALEVIQNSGPWNLAATSLESKVILVAARGDIRRYFSPRPFA